MFRVGTCSIFFLCFTLANANTKTGSFCRPGFKRILNKCYFIEDTKTVNWSDAVSECRSLNAELVSIETAEEFDALSMNKQIRYMRSYWSSANDRDSEGDFHFQSTGKHMDFARWLEGEPNNSWGGDDWGDEDCVKIVYIYGKYQMNDWWCTSVTHFICETEPLKK